MAAAFGAGVVLASARLVVGLALDDGTFRAAMGALGAIHLVWIPAAVTLTMYRDRMGS